MGCDGFLQLAVAILDVIVHNDYLVEGVPLLPELVQLCYGQLHTCLRVFLRQPFNTAHPLLQHLLGRRVDRHTQHVCHPGPELPLVVPDFGRASCVDVEDADTARIRLHGRQARTIQVPVDLSILEKLVLSHVCLERLSVHEEIVAALFLSLAWGPCRVTHTEVKLVRELLK